MIKTEQNPNGNLDGRTSAAVCKENLCSREQVERRPFWKSYPAKPQAAKHRTMNLFSMI